MYPPTLLEGVFAHLKVTRWQRFLSIGGVNRSLDFSLLSNGCVSIIDTSSPGKYRRGRYTFMPVNSNSRPRAFRDKWDYLQARFWWFRLRGIVACEISLVCSFSSSAVNGLAGVEEHDIPVKFYQSEQPSIFQLWVNERTRRKYIRVKCMHIILVKVAWKHALI